MKIAFLSASFPPDLDGIGDHTWWLSGELAAGGDEITVFTGRAPERIAPRGVTVMPCFEGGRNAGLSGFEEAWSSASSRFDWLVVQYNPFCYGARGFCPAVPQLIQKIRRGGTKVAAIFHETTVPRWPWKFTLMYAWQYPIFRTVCRRIDAGFISTNLWRPQVEKACPALRAQHLPVGSNLSFCDVSIADARSRLGLGGEDFVLGVFGQAHVSRQFDWIGECVRKFAAENPRTVVLYLGPGSEALRIHCGAARVIDAGFQDRNTAGIYLRAMDVLLSPFSDGISTRRGSVIAALQHGVPVATSSRENMDAIFRSAPPALLLSSARTGAEFATDAEAWWRSGVARGAERELRAFHDREFSWSRIAKLFVEGLRSS